jgi:hypothetical protein
MLWNSRTGDSTIIDGIKRGVDCQLRWPLERQLSWPVGGVSCRCSVRHSCRSFRFGLG